MTEPTSSSAPQAGGDETPVAYTVERHGNGWAVYRGRDHQHHGWNLGQLTETNDEIAALIERGLNALTRPTPAAAAPLTDEQAKSIHGHPFVRDCLLRYVDRPCDKEAADVVRTIHNAISGNLLGAAAAEVPSDALADAQKRARLLSGALAEAAVPEDVKRQAHELRSVLFHMARAPVAPPTTLVEVSVDRGRVWLSRGVQSFMLAYESDTDAELQWYARQLRAALASPVAPAGVPPIEDCPELNLSNYDEVDVERLNDWAIRASDLIAVLSAGAPVVPLQDSSSVHFAADDGQAPSAGLTSQTAGGNTAEPTEVDAPAGDRHE